VPWEIECGKHQTDPSEYVILNIGWDQAEIGMAGDSGEMFAATKGAIMAFTRSLARSLAPRVRVNCLAPGWIRTAWGDQASEYWQRRAVQESLLERWGEPADVARMARFLASSDASFITGQIMCRKWREPSLTRAESPVQGERIHFVTGKLAEHALRGLLAEARRGSRLSIFRGRPADYGGRADDTGLDRHARLRSRRR
jgi:hypothetical protein